MRARSAAALAGLALALAAALVTVPPAGRSAAHAAPLPRVSFRAEPGASILVHGTYPAVKTVCVRHTQPVLRARFGGTIEVGRQSDGKLFVIEEVSFEEYLTGIAEVPRTWPMEALKAQAIAARSYALAHLRYGDPTGRELGYQLCATDACQVYLGLGIADGPFGTRWRQAVDQTAGQVLLYHGQPADALYFSTSNGRTYGNETVFGSEPLSYLRPVVERDDGGSSLAHWRVALPVSDVGRFLHAAGAWPGGSVAAVKRSGADVVVSGGGRSAKLSVTDFRGDLNTWSSCLDPARYPGQNLVNGIPVPQTIPSKWMEIATSGGQAVVTGRGWGHGVGMVQWGAEGKAARGLTADQILAYYYGGLRPGTYGEPETIRLGIATGLTSVTIAGRGPVTASAASAGSGPWRVTGGKRLTVRHTTLPSPEISAGALRTVPSRARAGRSITVGLSLPQLSVVRLVLRKGSRDVPIGPAVTRQPGTIRVTGRIPPDIVSGSYPVEAVVTDGIDSVRAGGKSILITGLAAPPPFPPAPSPSPASPAPTTAPSPASAAAAPAHGSTVSLLPVLGALLILASVVLAGLALTRGKGRRRRDAPD